MAMILKFHKLLGLTLFVCLANNSYAASFDCSKASTPTEKTICSNKKLFLLDDVMGVYYRSELVSGKDQNAVKTEQRQWNKSKRDACLSDVNCLESAYLERLDGTVNASILNSFFLYNDWKKGKYSTGSRLCSYDYTKGSEKFSLVVYCAGDDFNNIIVK